MDQASEFMAIHAFPDELKMRINRYCMQKQENPSLNENNADKFFSMLSLPTKRVAMTHIHGASLRRVPVFGSASDEMIKELCDVLTQRTYGPDEYVTGIGVADQILLSSRL